MIKDKDKLSADYEKRVDTNENRSAIRKALTQMDFEAMIDFVIFTAQAGFKDGVIATLTELEGE